MPAEWEAHQRCFMAWPCREALWGSRAALARARRAYAAVASAIARFEPVSMVARPEHAQQAKQDCGPQVTVIPYLIDDSWLRDTGPGFVRNARGELAGVQWRFNGWGGKYIPYTDDKEFAARLLADLGLPCFRAPLIAEGGAMHVDGAGTLITTEQCLLNANRNPGMDRAAVERVLQGFLGVSKIVWLGQGLDGDETDGHVDEVLSIAAPGKLLMQGCDDPADPDYAVFRDNLARLRASRDARGQKFEISVMPAPARRADAAGRRLVLSYVNFYLASGAVIMPAFGDPADAPAAELAATTFPARTVVQIDARDIVPGGGGIHCITQQMPF